MKIKISSLLLIAILLAATILAGCGSSGSGGTSVPGGVNAGIASKVSLLPVQFIAQTNSFITLRARVIDGNGNALPDVTVNFTNMSLTGVLSAVTATTNNSGNAEVTIFSSTPGFATILAQVDTGQGTVRDRKTVFFSTFSATNEMPAPTMSLDVNSVPGNAIYDEPSDFILFQTPTDDTVEVLATVFDIAGVPVGGGMSVTWSTSNAEAKLIRTETQTDVFGQAKAIVQVTPATIRNTETNVNVAAFAGNGAANMVTLFLLPVVVSPGASSLSADPTTVATGGTSTITAAVILNTGAAAPNGTSVSFRTTCGAVTPFGQTSGGVATADFTAPATAGTCTVSATAGGVSIGSVDITVTAAPVCTASAPTISVTEGIAQNISAAAPAPVTYTFTVKNNDTATCTSTTFTLAKTSDTPAVPNADFVSSTLSATTPTPCALTPGGTCTATVIHTPTATPTATDTLATLVTVTAAGHTNATSTVTTTIVP